MNEWMALLAKGIAIALLAAIATGLPMAVLLTWDVATNLAPAMALQLMAFALLGSFAVGLPIAFLVYYLAGKQLAEKRSSIFIVANLAGVMMVLVTALLGGMFGALVFGLPSLVAANVFGLFGWIWILKPMHSAQQRV